MLILLGCAAMLCVASPAQTGTETSTGSESAAPTPAASQSPPADHPAPTEEPENRPLPDIASMMHDVETNQRKAEAIEKDYIYHSVETEQQVDGHGQVKKTVVTEADHYWLNGVPVRRVVKKNGKALTPEELAKEDDRIEKESAKAHNRREKADAEGKPTGPRGDDEITVSRLLELGSFTNPRREQLNGRDTIAVDYTGDPKAKTRNRAEDAIRDLRGTAWIDEQDHMLVRVQGQFINAFKVGGGLLVNIQKDTHFNFEQIKINDEVWRPAHLEAQGAARVLLFFNFNGSVHAVFSDYRKFRTTSTVLPGTSPVDEPQVPESPGKP
jgi:hypothetical protein